MKARWLLGGVGVVLLTLGVACGDDDAKNGPGKGGSGNGSGGAETEGGGAEGDDDDNDAKGGEGGAAGKAGAAGGGSGGNTAGSGGAVAGGGTGGGGGGAPPVTFRSRPAGITLEVDAAAKEAGFTLATSSITQEAGSSLIYTEWLAELVNGTNETQCLISMTGDFQNAAGATVVKYDTYAYGPAHDLGTDSKLSSPCVAPGERVPVWSNDIPEVAIPIADIVKLVVTIEPLSVPDAVVHPMTPTLSAVTQTYSATFQEWALSATAESTADIHNVSLTFWGKDGDFFVDSEIDYHLEDFLSGSTWAVDTSPLGLKTVKLSKVVPYFTFIEGVEGAALRVRHDARTSQLLQARSQAFASFDAARDRRRAFRSANEY
jgi:hypothetical protein